MKTTDLIKLLGTKDQQQEVEFLVVDKSTTAIVVMDITDETADLGKLFKAFKPKKKVSPNAELKGDPLAGRPVTGGNDFE